VADQYSYSLIAQNARILLRRYGRPLTFIRLNETPADSAKPWNGPAANGETTLVLQGTPLDPIGQRQLGSAIQFDNLLIKNSNLYIVANEGYDISAYTEVLDENKRYGISLIETIKPSTVPIVSYVWVKR
jgi:hypothetical protein